VIGMESQRLVAWTLRVGAYGSFALLVAAAVLKLAGQAAPSMSVARAGILVLLATPTVRIIAALMMFTARREWRMVLVSLGVLAIVVLASVGGMKLH
jgi:hypothetical protein